MEPGNVRAVDGSRACLLDTGSLWAIATRATAACWPSTSPAASPPARIQVAMPAEVDTLLARAASQRDLPEPRAVRTCDAWAKAEMAFDEYDETMAAIQQMRAGDLLLVDGVVNGAPTWEQTLNDRILEAATDAEVAVIAVAKRTGAMHNGQPAGPTLMAAARATGARGPWLAKLPTSDMTVGLLHPAAATCFRLDGDASAFGRLVPLCRDAAFPGYPYPLAQAHMLAAITEADAGDLVARLMQEADAAGAGAFVVDPHALLDSRPRRFG